MPPGAYQYLADLVVMHYYNAPANKGESKDHRPRCIVAVAGGPGSGKSTIAAQVAARVEEQGLRCQAVTVDGFVRPRGELSEAQLRRRGAIDTLDGDAVLRMVRALRGCGCGRGAGCCEDEEVVRMPGVDELTGEAVPDGQVVGADTRVVLVEGTFVLANAQPWRGIGGLVDGRWFVYVDPEVARERVAARYIAKGVVGSREEALERYDELGLHTIKYVNRHSCRVDVVIENNDEAMPLDQPLPDPR